MAKVATKAKLSAAFSTKQLAFQELFIGTLIYVLVLGLFNDYTSVVAANSFSTILYTAIVLEVLTFFTFMLKRRVLAWVGGRKGVLYSALRFFCVWLIMFLSKFVFIGAISMLFGEYITINGFFGILYIVVSVTIIHRLALLVFKRLGE